MSTSSSATPVPTADGARIAGTSDGAPSRSRRLVTISVTIVVIGWSAVELVSLGAGHTLGPEIYGVLVAVVAVATGILSLALLASSRRRLLVSAGVLVLWGVVALGGIGGTAAHIVGPDPAHGPVDARPRPVGAPLVFTVLGLVGGAALFYGQRMGAARFRRS